MNLGKKPCFPSNSSPVASEWEFLDPTPDIHALFVQFDAEYFWGKLDGVEIKWSSRMTLCAGLCRYEGRGGLCSISLSVPLLKLRPRRDLVETLIHEMIHAYLFVTQNNRDREGHGPEFKNHMERINKVAKTNVTIYHSFHNEVLLYKQHWWKCSGPCQQRAPYFGLVKRSMNRAPGPNDFWWKDHEMNCCGTYTKIKEPEGYGNKRKAKGNNESISSKKKPQLQDIRAFLTPKLNSTGTKEILVDLTQSDQPSTSRSCPENSHNQIQAKPTDSKSENQGLNSVIPFSGHGFLLGSTAISNSAFPPKAHLPFVKCPVCNSEILKSAINSHLDVCLLC